MAWKWPERRRIVAKREGNGTDAVCPFARSIGPRSRGDPDKQAAYRCGCPCPLAVTCRAAGSPSPAGYSCSASRSTVSMELIHVVHERKVRWPSCLRLVSFDGLEYGWFVDSWLVVWRGRRVARNGRIWLVGRAGTAHAARRRLAWRERAS